MILTETVNGVAFLRADLDRGAIAYVDADWIAADGRRAVPALVVADGHITFVPVAASPYVIGVVRDGEVAAGAVLDAIARRAVDAAGKASATAVAGTGRIAAAARALCRGGTADRRNPACLIDTSGDPQAIRSSAARVASLGTIVLAGEPAGRPLEVNLYPDVHVRGLTLVGVPGPSVGDQEGPSVVEEPAVTVTSGEPLPEAAWYRVT